MNYRGLTPSSNSFQVSQLAFHVILGVICLNALGMEMGKGGGGNEFIFNTVDNKNKVKNPIMTHFTAVTEF